MDLSLFEDKQISEPLTFADWSDPKLEKSADIATADRS
jgi:hypothetical protein